MLLVFLKNPVEGMVKTRLARTIGDRNALQIYNVLCEKIYTLCDDLLETDVYYLLSDFLPTDFEKGTAYVQVGQTLGERMGNAFKLGFDGGYTSIVCIGSDIPDLNKELIESAFKRLMHNDFVIGPALDGGYYLIGMKELHLHLFNNISWSSDQVYYETLQRMGGASYAVLPVLRDIDDFDDLLEFPEILKFIQ